MIYKLYDIQDVSVTQYQTTKYQTVKHKYKLLLHTHLLLRPTRTPVGSF